MKEFVAQISQYIPEEILSREIVISLIFIIAWLICRTLITRAILAWKKPSIDLKRRWIVNTKNALLLLLTVGLILVWAQELRTFALSLVAVAAAIAIATKEILLSISGAFFRTSTQLFEIGERIEINGVRGEVIDQNLLMTTLMEVSSDQNLHKHTGRIIALPNSLFVTNMVTNETFLGKYSLHVFSIPLKDDDDWEIAETMLQEAAEKECEPFFKEAIEHINKVMQKHALYEPPLDPKVWVLIPEPRQINLQIRIPVPTERKGEIEQAILRRFLLRFGQKRHALSQKKDVESKETKEASKPDQKEEALSVQQEISTGEKIKKPI